MWSAVQYTQYIEYILYTSIYTIYNRLSWTGLNAIGKYKQSDKQRNGPDRTGKYVVENLCHSTCFTIELVQIQMTLKSINTNPCTQESKPWKIASFNAEGFTAWLKKMKYKIQFKRPQWAPAFIVFQRAAFAPFWPKLLNVCDRRQTKTKQALLWLNNCCF